MDAKRSLSGGPSLFFYFKARIGPKVLFIGVASTCSSFHFRTQQTQFTSLYGFEEGCLQAVCFFQRSHSSPLSGTPSVAHMNIVFICLFCVFLLYFKDGDCTLKEAVIVSSVVAKVSLPVLHSSACLLKIAELPHTGANSVFIRTLLDKKYTLPHRVLSGVLGHFYSVKDDDRPCYLLWHQCLLVFVQRYKCHFSDEQKQLLLELCQVKHHHLVTPEILREINSTGDEVSSSC